jgi:farnesyl-diphosphate farnesyltransferase
LRSPLLRSVSRSFYLSIRLLPAPLRDPIALAYLLARATDTIADTTSIESDLRKRELAALAARIQGDTSAADSLQLFAARQKDAAERTLIGAVPACLAWLNFLPEADRADVRNVLLNINQGQTLDLQRFADATRIVALQTGADLDRYTYLVAGCVGEFWTSVCFRHLPKFTDRPIDEMMLSGSQYGNGLQLVNILRDAGTDLRAGRCYLPADELAALDVSPEALREEPARALPILEAWRERAERRLGSGIDYACAIRSMRVRLATALPALIGARTLALMREARAAVFDRKVKISRGDVRRIIFDATRTLASPRSLRAVFQKLSS